MTLQDAIARIIARNFTVDAKPIAQNGNSIVYGLTVLDSTGNSVAWPNVTSNAKGTITDVALSSFHGGKVTGLGDYPTAVIYGDVYMAHPGRPAQAEKAIAAMLSNVTPSLPTVGNGIEVTDPFADVPEPKVLAA